MHAIAISKFKASPFKTQLLETLPHTETLFKGKMKLSEQFHLALHTKRRYTCTFFYLQTCLTSALKQTANNRLGHSGTLHLELIVLTAASTPPTTTAAN